MMGNGHVHVIVSQHFHGGFCQDAVGFYETLWDSFKILSDRSRMLGILCDSMRLCRIL